jgi:hypothetical protein
MTSAEELLERIDASWHSLRPALMAGQLDGRLADGRTVKERLAGIAFWNETVAPVFAWMRGQPEPAAEQWYGGAALGIGDGEAWPKDQVHHAREAAWARSVSDDEVLTRLDHAHERAVAAVATLTPDECRTNGEGMISKADSCTYRLYDALIEQLP